MCRQWKCKCGRQEKLQDRFVVPWRSDSPGILINWDVRPPPHWHEMSTSPSGGHGYQPALHFPVPPIQHAASFDPIRRLWRALMFFYAVIEQIPALKVRSRSRWVKILKGLSWLSKFGPNHDTSTRRFYLLCSSLHFTHHWICLFST